MPRKIKSEERCCVTALERRTTDQYVYGWKFAVHESEPIKRFDGVLELTIRPQRRQEGIGRDVIVGKGLPLPQNLFPMSHRRKNKLNTVAVPISDSDPVSHSHRLKVVLIKIQIYICGTMFWCAISRYGVGAVQRASNEAYTATPNMFKKMFAAPHGIEFPIALFIGESQDAREAMMAIVEPNISFAL